MNTYFEKLPGDSVDVVPLPLENYPGLLLILRPHDSLRITK